LRACGRVAGAWKHCLRCAHVISLLQERMESYTTDILDLDCGETWHNAPPGVAARRGRPGVLDPIRRD